VATVTVAVIAPNINPAAAYGRKNPLSGATVVVAVIVVMLVVVNEVCVVICRVWVMVLFTREVIVGIGIRETLIYTRYLGGSFLPFRYAQYVIVIKVRIIVRIIIMRVVTGIGTIPLGVAVSVIVLFTVAVILKVVVATSERVTNCCFVMVVVTVGTVTKLIYKPRFCFLLFFIITLFLLSFLRCKLFLLTASSLSKILITARSVSVFIMKRI